jgi:hypothetical protein
MHTGILIQMPRNWGELTDGSVFYTQTRTHSAAGVVSLTVRDSVTHPVPHPACLQPRRPQAQPEAVGPLPAAAAPRAQQLHRVVEPREPAGEGEGASWGDNAWCRLAMCSHSIKYLFWL